MQLTITTAEAKTLIKELESGIGARKNWAITAVETGRLDDAVALVRELRQLEAVRRELREPGTTL